MTEILIIDDDPQIRRLLALILKGAGHIVHEAPNGRIGIELFRRIKASLVITDIFMPEQEGVETIRGLRKLAPSLPILAISGGGSIDSGELLSIASKFGATETLAKPFARQELLRKINRHLIDGADDATG